MAAPARGIRMRYKNRYEVLATCPTHGALAARDIIIHQFGEGPTMYVQFACGKCGHACIVNLIEETEE